MNRIKKNIKQYSKKLDQPTMMALDNTCIQYGNAYNYFTPRYSGINSSAITISQTSTRKNCRDVLVKDKAFQKQIAKVPARFWKSALDDAGSTIRSMWSNLLNKARKKIAENENLNDDQRQYCFWCLSGQRQISPVLAYEEPELPKSLKKREFDRHQLDNLLRRTIRKCKGAIPVNRKKRSFLIDAQQYSYRDTEEGTFIEISTMDFRKRISIPVKDKNHLKGSLRVVVDFDNSSVVINSLIMAKKKKRKPGRRKTIGLDKGMKKTVATSTGNVYGTDVNGFAKEKSDWEVERNANRNKQRSVWLKLLESGNDQLADIILANNIGDKHYTKQANRKQEPIKSCMNHALDEFFETENPKEIVIENLTWSKWNRSKSPGVNRRLSSWMKGYLDERLNYKAEQYNCKVTYVNPAYTSQLCPKCHHLGVRQGESFRNSP
ncbi:transposase [Erysipelotrichaceae bacterium RD49]|nr:transposase [Erysipelotrichaceae bacterium RD49]